MKTTIEQATLADMQYFIDSARNEGWNPGVDDPGPFYFTDPNGFFIEKIDGKSIGCISAVAYNDSYGFMGFYVVAPNFRHEGYGIRLWNHAIKYLGDRSIGLDGVVAQQTNYRKSGFKFYYNNIRFGGKAKGKTDESLQLLHSVPFPTLVAYDLNIVGYNRSTFLQHFITMPNSFALAKMEEGNLIGYGLIRKCETGYKVGPLFANNELAAHQIYLGLATAFEGDDIFLDILETNSHAMNLAAHYGLKKLGETARMYKGSPPKQTLENIFGVTTLELG